MDIGYFTEPVEDYRKAVDGAKDQLSLVSAIQPFRSIANDAYEVAGSDKLDWEEFKKGLRKERRKEFAGNKWAEKYGTILMPEVMFHVTMRANEFQVPWGLAFIRLKDVGILKKKKGVYIIKYPDDRNRTS